MKKLVQKSHYDYSTKHEAFPYQHEAFLEIKDKDYAAIFHEQGLGKTKIAIDLLLYWLKEREIDTVLIVTKKTLVKNWVEEFGEHTNPRHLTVTGIVISLCSIAGQKSLSPTLKLCLARLSVWSCS